MIVQHRRLYVAEFDLSGYLNGLNFQTSVEMQDDTVFGDAARSNVPGLETFDLECPGVWDAGAGLPDTVLFGHIALADKLFTATPVNGDEGAVAYFGRCTQGEYSFGGAVGDLNKFNVSLAASGGVGAIRGTVMGTGSKTSTASGTKRELGAVSATQKLYAGLHVLSVSGSSPTLDVIVRSDANSSAGGETTRITFAQQTAVGSVWATPVAGAISDTWWDVQWTIGGSSTPTFGIVVVVGIR